MMSGFAPPMSGAARDETVKTRFRQVPRFAALVAMVVLVGREVDDEPLVVAAGDVEHQQFGAASRRGVVVGVGD